MGFESPQTETLSQSSLFILLKNYINISPAIIEVAFLSRDPLADDDDDGSAGDRSLRLPLGLLSGGGGPDRPLLSGQPIAEGDRGASGEGPAVLGRGQRSVP